MNFQRNAMESFDIDRLLPTSVSAYLAANGWQQQSSNSTDSATAAVIWTKGNELEVSLPLRPDYLDYRQRMREVIDTLRKVEERPKSQVIADVASSGFDVMRVRVASPDASEGTLPFDEAAQIVSRSRDMVLAAACSTVAPRIYYPARKPREANEYLRRLRFGQTERGSFVFSILSPVAPRLGSGQPDLDLDEPFDRRVVEKLLSGITGVRNAAVVATTTNDVTSFERSVEQGVSANLCEALAGLTGYQDLEHDVEINFSWALTRPKANERQTITREYAQLIREAATVLKAKAPEEDFMAIGSVITLNRPSGAQTGQVVMAVLQDGQARKVSMNLDSTDYQAAYEAHGAREHISVVGTLVKEGRMYNLRDPRNIRRLTPLEN
jgi:hypothetical protein